MATGRPFGTIRTLPSGRYQARYTHRGTQLSSGTTFRTRGEARAWLATIEADITRGVHVDPTGGREHFGEFAQQWLPNRNLRPRTRETYASQLTHILAKFELVELRHITPGAVRAWHGALLRSGLHRNTVAKVYRLFRTMMDTAVEDGLLPSNPVHIKGAAAEQTVERPALEWDEVRRLAEAIEPRFRALVWTAATSGLRFGELTGLTRSHVDLTARTLRVEQALAPQRGSGPVLTAPKSVAAYRTVVLPATTARMLEAHLAEFTEEAPDSLVFTSLKGSPLLSGYFAPCWKRALATADVDTSVRFHDLRHLAGTSAAAAGASLREVMARMGHSSSAASLRYLKATERRDSEIAEAIEIRMNADLNSERS